MASTLRERVIFEAMDNAAANGYDEVNEDPHIVTIDILYCYQPVEKWDYDLVKRYVVRWQEMKKREAANVEDSR